jgi:hypothetical protein
MVRLTRESHARIFDHLTKNVMEAGPDDLYHSISLALASGGYNTAEGITRMTPAQVE